MQRGAPLWRALTLKLGGPGGGIGRRWIPWDAAGSVDPAFNQPVVIPIKKLC
jgi:hypothetical protein